MLASAAARFAVTELLPTPPLPDAMASTARRGRNGGVGRVLLGVAASAHHDLGALLAGHLAPVDLHVAHAGVGADAGLDVVLDLGPQRAAGDGELDGDAHVAVVVDRRTDGTMPSSTTLPPSSGSTTPRSSPVTSSAVGGANSLGTRRILPGAAV